MSTRFPSQHLILRMLFLPNTIAVVIANAKILFLIVFSFFLLFIETVLTVQLHWKLSDILF